MSLGIFVEGPSDRQTLPSLLHKLGQRRIEVRLVKSGKMLNADAMEPHIRALIGTQRGLRRILIFRDSECTGPEETIALAREPEAELNSRIGRPPISYVIVDHSIEGWLACDKSAVFELVGGTRKHSLLNNPEADCRPAQLLTKFFDANHVRGGFKKTTHNPKIAEQVNTTTIALKSPTFRQLTELLRSPSTSS